MPAQRTADLRIADHIARSDRETRFILVDPANLDAPGKRVDSQEPEPRPSGPWLRETAEARPVIVWQVSGAGLAAGRQQICISSSRRRQACDETRWRIDDEAVVDLLAPGTERPLEVPTAPKAQVIDDIEPIPHVAHVPVMRRLGNQVVNLTELRGLEIRKAAELLAADIARQFRIDWSRDAVRIVICRRHRSVVHSLEAAVRRAEIADIDAHVRRQLTLDRNRALPVIGLFVETPQRVFRPVITGGYVGLTEVQIVPLPTLAIGKPVFQIAVRNIVTPPWIPYRKGSVVPAPRHVLGCVRRGDVHGDADVTVRKPA